MILSAAAAPAAAAVIDSDLSGGSPDSARILRGELGARGAFQAEFVSPPLPAQAGLSGTILLTDPQGREHPARKATVLAFNRSGAAGKTETGDDGSWSLPDPGPGARVRVRLENAFWSVREEGSGKPYEWEAGSGTFRLKPDSANGRIGAIHLQFLEALDLFARSGAGIGWWNKVLTVAYPAQSDYFSSWDFSVHLSRAEAWDVNLHELGHAVMAAGTRSHGGGGSHKIDECYTQGLAWSEGFATFLAGAVRLDAGDPDARFEFLVPRRAPIRIENVPENVCRGDTNEWRVASGLWDLYDDHADGRDGAALGFARLWGSIQGQSMGGFPDAWRAIQKSLNRDETAIAAAALAQNTLLDGALSVRPPGLKPRLRRPRALARPDFDGPPFIKQ